LGVGLLLGELERRNVMVARAELYAILSEFADQEMETPLSPLAVAVYRRLALEVPEEFTEVLQFELASRSQLVVDQNEGAIQAIWRTHHPHITAAFWQMARETIQQAFGVDINTDDLELLPESDIRKALYECL
jgi:hypothetical protein